MTTPVKKKDFGVIVENLSDHYRKAEVAESLDAIKDLCYRYASQSGLTISIADVKTPPEKRKILDDTEKDAEKFETQFRRGIITDGERRQKEVEIWGEATAQVQDAMEKVLKAEQFNPIDMMVGSGARGNMMQVKQIAGMRGLVANPRGDMIPRPIKSNFREGLSMLEYFIATPGARKGLVDTALRTADSGYLTRRLVDVAQELIIREDDCGTTLGVWVENVIPDTPSRRSFLETKLFGRALVTDTTLADGTVLQAGLPLSDAAGGAAPRRPRRRPGAGAVGAHVRGQARHLRHLLRPVARDPQGHRDGRGRGRHRGTVHRRARHAAHDADVPHRRCRRPGHRRRSSPRRRAVRGSHPARQGRAVTVVGRRAHRRGRRQGPHDHRGRRRRRRRCLSGPERQPARRGRGPRGPRRRRARRRRQDPA